MWEVVPSDNEEQDDHVLVFYNTKERAEEETTAASSKEPPPSPVRTPLKPPRTGVSLKQGKDLPPDGPKERSEAQ